MVAKNHIKQRTLENIGAIFELEGDQIYEMEMGCLHIKKESRHQSEKCN